MMLFCTASHRRYLAHFVSFGMFTRRTAATDLYWTWMDGSYFLSTYLLFLAMQFTGPSYLGVNQDR